MAQWHSPNQIGEMQFSCGFCDHLVASDKGYFAKNNWGRIYICPNCSAPTFFDLAGDPHPMPMHGSNVANLPDEIAELYEEARRSFAAPAPTCSVMACRKLLMNIAVQQGAERGKTFLHYVEHLAENGFVPPNGKAWVDHIRNKGNEANHEIKVMSADDAKELIDFSEMLLKFIYEFPNRVPQTT